MNYASPQATHICNCRDNGMAPMFCPTGHLTECHTPWTAGRQPAATFPGMTRKWTSPR